jgi:hypothetical protein
MLPRGPGQQQQAKTTSIAQQLQRLSAAGCQTCPHGFLYSLDSQVPPGLR